MTYEKLRLFAHVYIAPLASLLIDPEPTLLLATWCALTWAKILVFRKSCNNYNAVRWQAIHAECFEIGTVIAR